MSTTLRIGRTGSRHRVFRLPIEIASQATAIHGVRGKGKTNTVGVMVEGMLKAGLQVIVIDPTDVWWGLKSSADGTSEGHSIVVLGGHHGDLPLLSTSGRVIADFAVNSGASMILSLRHLRKNEQRRLVLEFAEQLYHRKGEVEHRTPLFLAIDECSTFVPQRVMGETAQLVGAIEDIVRKGRASGLGVALIDQRPASVNKDVLSQIELLICHAVTGKHDRKALREWIEGKDSKGRVDEFEADLAGLEVGEAWFWHPVADVFDRVRVDMRATFDSSKTPEMGERVVAPSSPATVDLEGLRSSLEDAITEAEAKDPKILGHRIAELEATIRQLEAVEAGPDPEDVAAMVRDQVDRELVVALEAQRGQAHELVADLGQVAGRILGAVGELAGPIEALREFTDDEDGDLTAMDAAEVPVVLAPTPPIHRPEPVDRAGSLAIAPIVGGDGVTVPQQRILDALAGFVPLGLHQIHRNIAAVFAGQSPRSSGFSNNLGRLRSLGLIDYPTGGEVALTDAGLSASNGTGAPATLVGLHEAWAAKLSNPQGRIIRELISVYPASIDRIELAELASQSPTSSGYSNNLGRMRSLGIITKRGPIAATRLLFPAGLK